MRVAQSYAIFDQSTEMACEVKIVGKGVQALLDTGASISIIRQKELLELGVTSKDLKLADLRVVQADGREMELSGMICLPVIVEEVETMETLYVAPTLCRPMILGRNWLEGNRAKLSFNPALLEVGGREIPLGNCRYEESVVVAPEDIVIRPRTAISCHGKLSPAEQRRGTFQITPIDDPSYEKGEITLCESVVKVGEAGRVPIMLANTTNTTIKIPMGKELGRAVSASVRENVMSKMDSRSHHINTVVKVEEIGAPTEHRDSISKFLIKNRDIIAHSDKELGQTQSVRMKISTGDHPPIRLKPYRTPLHKRELVEGAVKDMLGAGVIERSVSPWSFPIVIVDKKDGGHRFCVDFRALNNITKPLAYPLPLIDDILALLGNSTYFSTLDLRSGYWQVALDEADREKTAFACHVGLYQFRVMPFGLANAPGVFQQLMSVVLGGLEQFAMAYLDDILIFSSSADEHLRHLQTVFARLRKHGLKIKLSKCQFMKKETKYLGFVIDESGVHPDIDKVEVMRAMPEPRTVREVRGFIGAIGYYRRFIPAFSRIATPLIALTKKYARFNWTEDCQRSFDTLKEQLTAIPLLAYPDLSKPMVLYTDASDQCIGACLTQPCPERDGPVPGISEEVPIYFLSHRLSPTQQRWPVIEKEAYAIVYALEKLNYYLNGATFVIKTDHKPLQYLFEADWTNKKIQQWALKLSGYNCKIEYLAGRENTCADLLSRIPKQLERESISVIPEVDDRAYQINVINSHQIERKPSIDDAACEAPDATEQQPLGELVSEYQMDEEIKTLKEAIEAGKVTQACASRYLIQDDRLYYLSNKEEEVRPRLYIPQMLRNKILEQCHDAIGHMGIDKTYELISRKYYWPRLYKQVTTYVNSCVTCQVRSSRHETAPLVEMDVPAYPFEKVSLDISGPYSETSQGNVYIVSFVDWLTNWPEAYAVADKKAQTVASLILTELFPRYGAPLEIVTDNGTENVNRIMKETMMSLNIKHITTSPYHPQSNAKVERFHRFLGDVLSKLTEGDRHNWDLYLTQALAAVRFSMCETTKFSPYYMLFGRDVVLPVDNLLKPRRKYMGEDHHRLIIEQQHKTFVKARRRIRRAQKKRNEAINKDRRKIELGVGDPVYYRAHVRQGKLDQRWRPCHRIVEQTGPVSFLIWDQVSGKVKRAHANDLKLAEIDEWEIPEPSTKKKRMRKATLVEPTDIETDSE